MKQQANQIRPGWVIENNGKQYLVTKINIITPGKGGAFIQVEMRGVDNGLKTEFDMLGKNFSKAQELEVCRNQDGHKE